MSPNKLASSSHTTSARSNLPATEAIITSSFAMLSLQLYLTRARNLQQLFTNSRGTHILLGPEVAYWTVASDSELKLSFRISDKPTIHHIILVTDGCQGVEALSCTFELA